MSRRERIQFFCLWFFLGVVPLFLRPLWEPDEARYAEIPREMLATGDWLTPRLNQVLYFEKPPLQYWLSALSMKVFGNHAFAARLPLALATGMLLWCGWRLSRRLGANEPMRGAFMAATTLLVFICHQILTLDALFSALLVVSLAASIEAISSRFESRSRSVLGWTLFAFGANALALLTKGLAAPVLLGGVLLGSLPWAWAAPQLRKAVIRFLLDPMGWMLFSLIGLPWFVLVERANPGHARFFFIHEHFSRYTSHIHGRQGSSNPVLDKLYFFGILLVGLLPWLTASLHALARSWGHLRRPAGADSAITVQARWTIAMLFLAFAVPLVFFSLSGSKLPPYILPAVVPLLALACAFGPAAAEARLRASGREVMVLGALLILAGPFLLKEGAGIRWALAVGLAFLGIGAWTRWPFQLTGPRWMTAWSAGLLLLLLAAQQAVGPDKSVSHLVGQAPANARWISCGNYFQGIAFEAGMRTVVVAGTGELAFGRSRLSPAEQDRWFPEGPQALSRAAQRFRSEEPASPVWALVTPGQWRALPPPQKRLWDEVDHSRSACLVRMK